MKPAILDACCTFVMGILVSGLSTVQGQVLLQLADCKGAAGKFMVPRMYGKPHQQVQGQFFILNFEDRYIIPHFLHFNWFLPVVE
jgi:hypothetical protein